jgi:hypothetical protein
MKTRPGSADSVRRIARMLLPASLMLSLATDARADWGACSVDPSNPTSLLCNGVERISEQALDRTGGLFMHSANLPPPPRSFDRSGVEIEMTSRVECIVGGVPVDFDRAELFRRLKANEWRAFRDFANRPDYANALSRYRLARPCPT